MILITIALVFFFFGFTQSLPQLKTDWPNPVNGGAACAFCTASVVLLEELALVHNETVDKSMQRLCSYIPEGIFQAACQTALEVFGPSIIKGLYERESADVICHALRICYTEKGQPECHLYPWHKSADAPSIAYRAEMLRTQLKANYVQFSADESSIWKHDIFQKIRLIMNEVFQQDKPAFDHDNDGYGINPSLRGSSWKGKDCNDFDAKIHPGAIPIDHDVYVDSNCNGIFGRPVNSNQSYEELFCEGSKQIGVAVLGESMAGHYHIPEEWLNAYLINPNAFKDLFFIIGNQMDWPQLSAVTGYMNSTWPVIKGPMRSVYNYIWNRNKCNFRDFQNIGINGADSHDMLYYLPNLVRDQDKDRPMILFYSLVGRDVCNGDVDTFKHMTRPDVFYKNIITALSYLDTRLPRGSHVLLTGMANGSLLYEYMGNRVHPLGRVRGDIKYFNVYEFGACLKLSPCVGWLTTNATSRKLSSEYAYELSNIVKNITLTQKYKNFDMAYSEFPLYAAIKKWEAKGGEAWQLIESVDGFHINQITNALVADEYWNFILTEHPDWLGQENPYNDQITKIFGEQGGY